MTTKEAIDFFKQKDWTGLAEAYHKSQVEWSAKQWEEFAEQVRQKAREEIWHYLNLLEMRQPESLKTDNWRNWKYIRNSIADRYCSKNMRYQQEIVDRLAEEEGNEIDLTGGDGGW